MSTNIAIGDDQIKNNVHSPVQAIPFGRPHKATAERFVELLTGRADTAVNLRLFSDRERGAGQNLFGSIDDLWPQIEGAAEQHLGVFIIVNEGGNTDAEITHVRALFIDGDDIPFPAEWEWHEEPSFVVARGPERWHAYWLMEDCPTEAFGDAQRRLAARYNSDPVVFNLSRVMRLPGTLHVKGDPVPVRLHEKTDHTRSIAALVAGLPPAPVTEARKVEVDFEWDTPIALGRAEAFLNSQPAQWPGNHAGYAVAARLTDLGISPETAADLMDDRWNPQGASEWREEIDAVVAHAGEYRQNAPGVDTVAPVAQVWPADLLGKLAAEPGLRALSLSDLLAREVGPVRELVSDLIERGIVTFLSAPGGTHKSRLALQLGLCLGTGTPIFGRPVERVNFVYLSYEDHADEVTRRTQAIAKRLKLPADGAVHYLDLTSNGGPLAVVSEDGVAPQPFHAQLRAILADIPGHKFIVADSTYNLLQFTGQAKINESSVKAGIEFLGQVCRDTDSTMLALWHPSQAGQERGDASGWSVAWNNTPRARLALTAVDSAKDAFTLETKKRNNAAKGAPITLHWSDGCLLPLSDAAGAERQTLFQAEVLKIALEVADLGIPFTRQRHPEDRFLIDVERRTGVRPSAREFKEELSRQVSVGNLRYQSGKSKQKAGYFRPDGLSREDRENMPPKMRAAAEAYAASGGGLRRIA